MALRMAAALSSASAGIILAERVPVAFHEAGHAVVACHIGEAGIRSDSGWRGNVQTAVPLLRYVTITPRQTAKGQLYMGETKLTVRWRDMPERLTWARCCGRDDAKPLLNAAGVEDAAGLLGLARIAYLFGGRAAEVRLASALQPAWWQAGAAALGSDGAGTAPAADGGAAALVAARVARLMERPGNAFGDLRKARQIALSSVACDTTAAAGDAARDAAAADQVLPPFWAAYAYTDDVLALRWPLVCALAGALLVRGTVDGGQADELARAQEGAAARGRKQDAGAAERLLALASSTPLVFGCLFALGLGPVGWPARDCARFAGPTG